MTEPTPEPLATALEDLAWDYQDVPGLCPDHALGRAIPTFAKRVRTRVQANNERLTHFPPRPKAGTFEWVLARAFAEPEVVWK